MNLSPSVNRIAFLSSWDPQDEEEWSGMLHSSRKALASQFELVDVRVDAARPSLVDRGLARSLGSIGRSYLPAHGVASALKWGRATTQALRSVEVDVVVAVAGSSLTAFADIRVPLISISDSTFVLISSSYPGYKALPSWVKTQATWVERRAWRRSDSCVVSSRWACDSLIADYGISAKKCHVVPFGPGVKPPAKSPVSQPGVPIRLLLVGGDWRRKRGDRAIAMLPFLHRMGVSANLTLVGAPRDLVRDVEGVTWLPRQSRQEMADLYASHDILLDLAEANCASVTLVDAAAWGLPTVATDVGAAREIVIDGLTGFVIPSDERTPEAAAHAVAEIVRRNMNYQMQTPQPSALKGRFTWSSWAQEVSSIVNALRPGT